MDELKWEMRDQPVNAVTTNVNKLCERQDGMTGKNAQFVLQ